MPVYKYKAIDKNKRNISGTIEAASEGAAASILQEKAEVIIALGEMGMFSRFQNLSSIFDRVKIKDLVVFFRQFAVMISANVSIVQSLKIIADQTENSAFKTIIFEIADEVDGGARLSDSMARRPKVFSNFLISVVRSGETSGRLDEILNYLADETEKDYDMTNKIKNAMIYPIFVLSGLLIVGTVMMVFVVPKLTDIMSESGGELPLATRMLIGLSDFMASFWWLIFMVIIGSVIGLKFYARQPQGKKVLDRLRLRLPIFGRLFQRIYLVRFTRSMNTLITGGLTITASLKIVADVVDNQVYKDLILETIKEVEEGNSVSSVFIQSEEIPKMVSQMLSIGEKTGKLDLILERITDFYGREISNIVANLMTLMEPIIMVVMGVAVGIMVAAIIMPMYSMADQF